MQNPLLYIANFDAFLGGDVKHIHPEKTKKTEEKTSSQDLKKIDLENFPSKEFQNLSHFFAIEMLQKTQLDEVFLHKKKELFDESLKSLVGLSKGDDFLSSHIPSNYQLSSPLKK